MASKFLAFSCSISQLGPIRYQPSTVRDIFRGEEENEGGQAFQTWKMRLHMERTDSYSSVRVIFMYENYCDILWYL